MWAGSPFKAKASQLASRGAADFDGDNKAEVFRTTPKGDGNLRWAYSSGGAGACQNLAYAGPDLPAAALQFGKFNPDAQTDVFASIYGSGTYHWNYSPSGAGSFVAINSRQFADRLALGDFSGDGLTDVFTASLQGAAYQWGYFPGGSGALHSLAYAGTDPAMLRFGDFDGDGVTDVFAASQLAVAGLANGDGTFELGSTQNFGSAWGGRLSLADLNHDGKADLLWNSAPLNDTDVDTYATALNSGNGAFSAAQPGAVYTGLGYFGLPQADAPGRPPTSLTLVSTGQGALSNALFVVQGSLRDVLNLPLLER